MQLEELSKLYNEAQKRFILNWSAEVGYVFVTPSDKEKEYETIRPMSWPKNITYELSQQWAIHIIESGTDLVGTPFEKYKLAIWWLASEIEVMALNACAFYEVHKGDDPKTFAFAANSFAAKNKIPAGILFDQKKGMTAKMAVMKFYKKNAKGIFYP